MKDKKKWKKIIPFALLALGTSAVAVACDNEDKPSEIGPETGAYYYDADNGEYFIYLNEGNYFTFMVKDATESGSYTLDEDGTLKFKFSSDDYSNVTATWKDGILTLTYGSDTMRFLKKVNYDVTFDTDGGSAVNTAVVWNGRTLAKPADPVKNGYHFIGWYTDSSYETLFAFGATPIVENITLYARWEKAIETQSEYTVTLDYGYDEKIETMTTVSGKLFDIAEPVRSGYTFKGWWLSDYEDGDKLTAAYGADTVFKTNRTIYALWEATDSTAAPMVEVSATQISWNKQSSAATLRIEGPNGFDGINQTIGATAGSFYALDFASLPAGDYKVSLTVGSATTTRYYRNKALDRVWQFSVVGKSLLIFNSVQNAQKYIVTVDCGDDDHIHEDFDNGNSTTFDFSNCKMQEGGIRFTVTAKAYGYADSVATTFVYDNMLGKVTGYYLDEETDTLVWDGVENAASYVVSVNGGAPVDIGNKTSFSLKNYSGEISVSVYAKTSGYNSPDATTYSYTKSALASPSSITIVGNTLGWATVEGATKYEVKIGSRIFDVTDTSFDLSAEDKGIEWTTGEDYRISVRAIAANETANSLWSDEFDARYYALYQSMTYNRNTVTWRAVIGATKYEVKVNNGAAVDVTDGSTSATVELTQGGYNTVSVRFFDGETASEWVTTDVYAYTITLDSRGGSETDNLYKAVGDVMTLPDTLAKDGYDFAGWYNIPGGAQANGAEYDAEYFAGNGDVTLYAYWTPKVYTINLDYGDYAAADSETTAKVVYGKGYTLPVPVITDGRKVFKGWYADANGTGVFTDANGKSKTAWMNTQEDITLYAYYVDGLDYSYSKTDDSYYIKAGESISQITNLYIPKEYNGKPVRDIITDAFKGCTSLLTVSIPNTIRSIDETAFEGCTKITEFIVRDEGSLEAKYSSLDGTLVGTDRDGSLSIIAIPLATTGVYTVPAGVQKIPQNAFKSMSGLTEVNLPASVVRIEKEAFVSCTKLTTITFLEPEEGEEEPEALTLNIQFIGSSCTKLSVINFPARLNEFDRYETDGTANQTDLTISEAFSKLTKLTEINVTGSNYRFYSSIDGVLCNASGGRTGDTILYCPLGKTGEYVVPNTITKIADRAFAGTISTTTVQPSSSNGLTKLVFHSGIQSIGEMAFYNNRKVTEIVFEASTAPTGLSIGDKAFYWCTLATTIAFEEEGSIKSREISAEDSDTGEAYTQYYFEYTKSCGITSIGEDAFYACKETKLVLPSTLETIGKNAFKANTDLTALDLSHISPTLEFEDMAFSGCTKLKSVNITENVGYVQWASVFYNCTALATLQVSENSPYYSTDDYGVLYDKKKTSISYFPEAFTGDYVIPNTIVTIGGGVFKDKTILTKINIPASVEKIGPSAFEGCMNLSEIVFETDAATLATTLTIDEKAFYGCTAIGGTFTLPARTTSVGDEAFIGTRITALVLNEGLTEIGDSAFKNIDTLKSVSVSSTVKTIGKQAFYGCKALNSLTFVDTQEGATAVELTVGESVFYGCKALTSVVLPERLQYISDQMFYSCTSLKSVTVPTTVGNTKRTDDEQNKTVFQYGVGSSAFEGCTVLSTIDFTKLSDIYDESELESTSVKPLSFGNKAFLDCIALVELNLPNRIAAAGQVNPNVNAVVTDYSGYDVFAFVANTTYGAYAYTDAFIGSEMTSITSHTSLQRINVEEGGNFASYDGVLYTKGLSKAIYCPQARRETVEIPYQTETFAPCSFRYCTSLEGVVFQATPDGKSETPFSLADAYPLNKKSTSNGTLGGNTSTAAFYSCTNLQSIVFPKRLTSIGAYALYSYVTSTTSAYANGFTTISFADGCELTSIGDGAFQNTYIENFTLPSNVTTVGEKIFSGCDSLTSLTVSDKTDSDMISKLVSGASALQSIVIPTTNTYLKEENGIIYSYAQDILVFALAKLQATEIVIPATVKEIKNDAFATTTLLKKVTFADGTEPLTIGDNAFKGCNIEEIVLPNRLTSLGKNIFDGCASLKTVTFGSGLSCAIPEYAFRNCTSLETINLPKGVLAIGTYAFYNCSALKTFTFETNSQLTTIGAYAFQNCSALTEITLPATVTSLGAEEGSTTTSSMTTATYTFSNCTALERVTLSDGIALIGNYTFSNCSNLRYVNLPKNLEHLGYCAFANCTKLETAEYNVEASETPVWKSIGSYAFKGCEALTSFTIPSSMETMYSYIFQGCASLAEVNYNSSADIGSNMFQGCASLAEVNFGSSANFKAIGTSAFSGCQSLTSVTLPKSCINVGTSAFANCTDLVSFTYSATSGEGSIGNSAFSGCTSLKTVNFDENSCLKTILGSAFSGCTSLTEISIPDSVTHMTVTTATSIYTSGYTFKDCTSLKKVKLSKNLTILPYSAFKNCTSLKTVDFGTESVLETIGSYAFDGCSALTAIELPDSIIHIGPYAFKYCTALKTVGFGEESKLESIMAYAFDGCSALTNIKLPASLKSLGGTETTISKLSDIATETSYGYIFRNCTSLKTIAFPDEIKTLPTYCFAGCTALETVDFNKVAAIGTYAFDSCEKLGSKGTLDITNVEKIANYAFRNCSSLRKLLIKSIQSIGVGAFSGTEYELVPSDDTIKIDDGMIYSEKNFIFYVGEAETLTLPSGITTINAGAFMNNTTLKTIVLPDGVETISDNAFYKCTALQTIDLKNVKSVGSYAFYGCSALTVAEGGKLDLSNATSIGSYAFYGCSALETSVDAGKAASVGNYAFYALPITSAKLSSVEAIGKYAFAECSELVTVDFGDKLTSILYYAFENCTSLKTVSLPDTLTVFGGAVTTSSSVTSTGFIFAGCTSLTEVKFGNSLEEIGTHNFDGCTALETVNLGGIKKIGTSCFANCSKLTTIDLRNVTDLRGNCFENCVALEEISLDSFAGNNTYNNQFIGCTALTKASIPNATLIPKSMFEGCSSLTEISAPNATTIHIKAFAGTALKDFDFSAVKTINANAFEGTPLTGDLELPEATSIGASAFQGCTKLTSVSLVKATTINANAFANCTGLTTANLAAFVGSGTSYITDTLTGQFSGCTSLTTVQMPKAKYIANYMFEGCTSLTDVDLTNNSALAGIGAHAFDGCSALTELDFSKVKLYQNSYYVYDGIGDYAFANCPKLKTVTLQSLANLGSSLFEGSPDAKISWSDSKAITVTDNEMYVSASKTFIKYLGSDTSYRIPDGLTTIAKGAFQGNTTLQSIDLNGVTKLSDYAFADCTELKSIDLSSTISNVTNCGKYTFSGCTALESVTYKSTFTTVNEGLFQGCTSLTSFDFSKIKTINASAFEGSGLTGTLSLPQATAIYTDAFANCTGIEKVVLSAFVGSSSYNSTYTGQFRGCTSLEEVELPKAKYIASSMFEGCTALADVKLAETSVLATIYSNAFQGCTALKEFDFSAVTSVYAGAFKDSGLTGELHLPKATSIYANAFENCTGITSVILDKATYIYTDAFANCTGIEKVVLSAFVGSTSYNADGTSTTKYTGQFRGCTSLEEVEMPKAKYIASSMFEGCTSLTKVDFSEDIVLEYVYSHAFDGCTALEEFDFSTIRYVYEYAFKDCTSIESATLSAFNNTNGSGYSINSTAFAGWTAEQSISFPNFKWSKLSESFQTQWTTHCQAVTTWAEEDD